MKWHQRIRLSARMAVKGAAAGWKGAGFNFVNWMGRTFWGIDNSTLVTNETIFSVVSRLANSVSSLPIKLHQKFDTVDNQASDVLINAPNENMSGFELMNQLEVSRNEDGNGYAIIQRDIRMQPESILPVSAAYVTPFLNSDDGALWYEVRGANNTLYIHNLNMIHVKHISGVSRLKGIKPLDVLCNTIKYDKAVQEFSLSEMEKRDSFVLEYGAHVDKDTRDAIVADFRRFYAENGGVLFQEPGVKVNELERKYNATDTLASERVTRSRVANVFNVPVSFLNDTESQSYGSNEQMMIQFVQMTLTPIVRQYEHEFNRKLLTAVDRQNGLYFKFNLGGLLRGDTTARTQFYQTMLRSGGMKPNEVRMLEDLPPEEGKANELWISGDLYPIEMDPTARKSTKTGGGKDE